MREMVLDNFAFTLGTLAKNVARICCRLFHVLAIGLNQIKSKLEIHMSYYEFVNF